MPAMSGADAHLHTLPFHDQTTDSIDHDTNGETDPEIRRLDRTDLMNAEGRHGVRGLGSIGDSGELTGQGSATLGSSQSPARRYFGDLPALV